MVSLQLSASTPAGEGGATYGFTFASRDSLGGSLELGLRGFSTSFPVIDVERLTGSRGESSLDDGRLAFDGSGKRLGLKHRLGRPFYPSASTHTTVSRTSDSLGTSTVWVYRHLVVVAHLVGVTVFVFVV